MNNKKISILLIFLIFLLSSCKSNYGQDFITKTQSNNWKILAGDQNVLYRVHLEGSRSPIFATSGYYLSISPDGEKVLYRESVKSNNGYIDYLTIFNIDGGHKERLFEISDKKDMQNAVWSPVNNNEIAFLKDYNYDEARCSLYLYNLSDKSENVIVKNIVNTLSPLVFSWSPDGKMITFTHVNGKIMIVHKDGTHLEELTADCGDVPSWSPDGKKIAYRAGKNWREFSNEGKASKGGRIGDGKYYIIDVKTKIKKEVFNNKRWLYSLNIFSQPIWSPDSQYLLFLRYIDFPCSCAYYIVNVDKAKIIYNFNRKVRPNPNTIWIKENKL